MTKTEIFGKANCLNTAIEDLKEAREMAQKYESYGIFLCDRNDNPSRWDSSRYRTTTTRHKPNSEYLVEQLEYKTNERFKELLSERIAELEKEFEETIKQL